MPSKIKILAVSGSLELRSRTSMALRSAVEGARSARAEVRILELRDLHLPLLGSPFRHPNSDEDIEEMRGAFRAAEGLLIATPEYHGSYSGALKTAFDWMGFEEFEGKMAALVGVAGGSLGPADCLGHLRTVLRQLHAWVVPNQVSIADSHRAFDEAGRPKDPKLAARLHGLGRDLVKFSYLHRQERSNAFVRFWERCVQNPGGEGR